MLAPFYAAVYRLDADARETVVYQKTVLADWTSLCRLTLQRQDLHRERASGEPERLAELPFTLAEVKTLQKQVAATVVCLRPPKPERKTKPEKPAASQDQGQGRVGLQKFLHVAGPQSRDLYWSPTPCAFARSEGGSFARSSCVHVAGPHSRDVRSRSQPRALSRGREEGSFARALEKYKGSLCM